MFLKYCEDEAVLEQLDHWSWQRYIYIYLFFPERSIIKYQYMSRNITEERKSLHWCISLQNTSRCKSIWHSLGHQIIDHPVRKVKGPESALRTSICLFAVPSGRVEVICRLLSFRLSRSAASCYSVGSLYSTADKSAQTLLKCDVRALYAPCSGFRLKLWFVFRFANPVYLSRDGLTAK